jgi:hypothetical protein
MPLDYQQQRELQSRLQQTGRSVLENVIVYGFEAVKFVVNFIKDMISQAMGR